VNHLMPSHMFGEAGLRHHARRNASVTQSSKGDGRLLQLSLLDFQAIKAGRETLAVQGKVRKQHTHAQHACKLRGGHPAAPQARRTMAVATCVHACGAGGSPSAPPHRLLISRG
jgi:CRP-like cAMP-binding protein